MTRRIRLLFWLGGVLIVVGLAYASSPWVLTTVIKHGLAAKGFRDIRIHFDYPRWRGMQVHGFSFTTIAGDQQIRIQLPTVVIGYHLSELVTGQLESIQVAVASVRIRPIPAGSAATQVSSTGQATAVATLAALVSGQWLSQLPLHELSLDQLSVRWQVTADTEYVMQLSARLQNAQLRLSGDIQLPPVPKPIALAFDAGPTGKARLILTSTDASKRPLLAVTVTSVDTTQARILVNGELHASLKSLAPMMTPWQKQMKQVSGIDGALDSQWQARINDTIWQLTGEAVVHGLSARWRGLVMPPGEMTIRFSTDAQKATLQANLSTASRAVVIQAEGVHEFPSGRGHAELKLTPLVFGKSGFVLSQLLKSWPYPFDIDAGRASAGAQLQWHNMLKTNLVLDFDKLGGHYNKVAFRGLSGEIAMILDKAIATGRTAHVHVDMLDVGFPVENITMRFTLSPVAGSVLPVVRLQKFSAELLGGRAYTGPFALDFTRNKNAFVVQLEHIGLHEIMLLERQEGLEGSGLLDGSIPVTVSDKGIEVVHGRLAVRAPGGIIRYMPTPKVVGLAQVNPSVKIVVDALSNFHYQVMNVRGDYKTTGDLDLQVQLEGSNPEWQAGQPVHLNLNLQENIPALLRSLQLSGEISERLRQHYQKTH